MNEKIRLYIWGTGSVAEKIISIYFGIMEEIGIEGYIDNDKAKWGMDFHGIRIYSPEILSGIDDCKIYIAVFRKDDVIYQIKKSYSKHLHNILEDSYFKKIALIKRYESSCDVEIKPILRYLDDHPLDVFNYEFKEKYDTKKIEVFAEDGLFYVMRKGKKLFFSRSFRSEKQVRDYYLSLLIEQDDESPHKYVGDDFFVDYNSVFVDAGAAEGVFTLDYIDVCKKAYLFEPDNNWCEALSRTFQEYGDKVVIINKCVSNYTDGQTVKLDNVISEKVNFIKMDIEGEELYALQGGKRIINNSPNIKCSICTYHQEFAYEAIRNYMESSGFCVTHTKGYMWYIGQFNEMRAPILRRGIIRAKKQS